MLKRWHGFISRRVEGHAILEFAIVLPVMLLLIMGIVEYSLIMFASAVLEGATNYAARVGQTGYYISSSTGAACAPTATQVANDTQIQLQSLYIVCIAGTRVTGLFDTTQLSLTATDYSGFSSSNTPTFTSCSNSPSATAITTPPSCSSLQNFGSAGDVVVYTLSYPWHIITPLLQPFLCTDCTNNPGVFTISSSAVVKNEPYSTTSR
jgi:Flp pilus assembly protein TadG